MFKIRTDLAMEMREGRRELQGVAVQEETSGDAKITRVEVLDERGARALGKPVGHYITIESDQVKDGGEEAEELLARELRPLLPAKPGVALVVGLGNGAQTCDALGPRVVSRVLVTRHALLRQPTLMQGRMRSVCAVAPGVLGRTGVETAELVRGVVGHVRPDVVIAVDALAARRAERILTTVQMADSGVQPGSGMGDTRSALDQRTLGVPVLAVGVPMVVWASTIWHDALEKMLGEEEADRRLQSFDRLDDMVVTPASVDEALLNVTSLVAGGLNRVLQPDLSLDEIRALQPN